MHITNATNPSYANTSGPCCCCSCCAAYCLVAGRNVIVFLALLSSRPSRSLCSYCFCRCFLVSFLFFLLFVVVVVVIVVVFCS